jgi:hypothetical protein
MYDLIHSLYHSMRSTSTDDGRSRSLMTVRIAFGYRFDRQFDELRPNRVGLYLKEKESIHLL